MASFAYVRHVANHTTVNASSSNFLLFALDHQTVIKLAHAGNLSFTFIVHMIELNLLPVLISSSLWIAQVATDNLISCHHDICALASPTNVPTVALIFDYVRVRL